LIKLNPALVGKNTIEKNQFFLLLLVCTVNYGQAVRKYSNEFMNIGVDAAALGMANVHGFDCR
jgi:hypothetical protein